MGILINLSELLREKNVTSKELCEYVGITEANMSILRSGKARGIRFDTLEKICEYLRCKPGDIMDYEGKENHEKDY
ncbi:MAG: helix-turn-helix transcriptional regulator [Candidatus Izemoplasmatales bacterium]|jgi:putative transcriptional regulator|nr:helix-turn-helix transcriptional regulator [Candidatus Izemoplasmatales bacterium]